MVIGPFAEHRQEQLHEALPKLSALAALMYLGVEAPLEMKDLPMDLRQRRVIVHANIKMQKLLQGHYGRHSRYISHVWDVWRSCLC